MKYELNGVVKGDYERIDFTITNPDSTVRNITGEVVHFYAKRTTADASPLIHKDSAGTGGVMIQDPNPPAGTPHGYVAINPTDLAAIALDTTLVCAIKHIDASGNPASTEFDLPVRIAAGS